MGIVKISDELHEAVRQASGVMERSMNSQAEFWMKIGRLAEKNPTMTYEQILQLEIKKSEQKAMRLVHE